MIVTRPLDELIAAAAQGKVVAGSNRNGPVLSRMGRAARARRRSAAAPYVSTGLVVAGGRAGPRAARAGRRPQARRSTSSAPSGAATTPSYPLLHADQDLINAVIAARADDDELDRLRSAALAEPAVHGPARCVDERTLRCAYADGSEPYVVHHWLAKPWLEPTHHGVYSQLLRRLLIGDDVAIRVPEQQIPLRLRSGVRGLCRAQSASTRASAFAGTCREPAAPHRISAKRAVVKAAFYCVADERYFLGAVGLINSLRLVGHDEPIYLLDCGLTERQRELLGRRGELVDGPRAGDAAVAAEDDRPAGRDPAEVTVLDRHRHDRHPPLDALIERAARDAWSPSRTASSAIAPSGASCSGSARRARTLRVLRARLLRRRERRARCSSCSTSASAEVDFELTFWRRNVREYPFLLRRPGRAQRDPHAPGARRNGRRARRAARGDAAVSRACAIRDEATLACAYRDGREPYVAAPVRAQAVARGDLHGVYSRLCRRLLVAGDIAIRPAEDESPLRMRSGRPRPGRARSDQRHRLPALASRRPPATADRERVEDLRRLRASRRTVTAPAFYCVADERYFLGAVGDDQLAAAARPREPIHCSTAACTPSSARCSPPRRRSSTDRDETPPWLLKTIAPLRHPADGDGPDRRRHDRHPAARRS